MPTATTSVTPITLYRLASAHRWLLFGPAIAGALLAAASTLVVPRDWSAEQGLLIRSDAAGYANQRLGKFTDLSEMKTVQETLLELARSQTVIAAALEEVGPPSDRWFTGGWPSAVDVDDFRTNVALTPPGGAEFGKTEVFYLSVKDPDRDRAVALVGAITTQLEQRLQQLRDRRAESLVVEVERSVTVARESLDERVAALSDFERSVGADLIELRHLTSPNGGQSELGQQALALEAERRRSLDNRRRNEALLAELRAAVDEPSRLIASPDSLLTSQPALRRLKNGLVDAQLAVARTAGARTDDHPFVAAARHAQQRVQEELAGEIPTAIAGVELELKVAEQREAELDAELDRLRDRSASLAGRRSHYTELLANVEGQTRVLENALQQLADAESHRAGAASASLLARIDAIEAGVRPLGASRKAVIAAGGLAGLIFAASLVWVLHGPAPAAPPVAPTSAPVEIEPGGVNSRAAAFDWTTVATRGAASRAAAHAGP